MIRFEINNMDQLKNMVDPKIVDKAFNSAIGKTAAKARTFISKEVRKEYNIKARDISRSVKIIKIRGGGRIISYSSRRKSLINFSPSLKKINSRTGVTVRVKKKNGRKLVKGGFAGFGRSGNYLVFMRNKEGRKYTREGRNKPEQALDALTGPAVTQMVKSREVMSDLHRFVKEEQDVQFERAMDFFLEKQTGMKAGGFL